MMFNNNYVNLPLGRQSVLKGKKKSYLHNFGPFAMVDPHSLHVNKLIWSEPHFCSLFLDALQTVVLNK